MQRFPVTVAFFAAGLILALGCSQPTDLGPGRVAASASPQFPRFQATTKPQRAVFLTESWDGGGGDPVQTAVGARPVKVGGVPVLLLFQAQQQVRENLGPQPAGANRGIILVDAQIHLDLTSVRTSAEGGGGRQVYSAVIDELYSSQWFTGR